MFYISPFEHTRFRRPTKELDYKAALKKVQVLIRPLRSDIKELKRELKMLQNKMLKKTYIHPQEVVLLQERIQRSENKLLGVKVKGEREI